MMSNRTIAMAAACLLTVLFAVTSTQAQHDSEQQQQQQLEQYDSNTSPQHNNGEHISGHRFKRMYAMCPPEFSRIGNECYYISRDKQNYLDAHFECKVRNSKLAEPMKYDDKSLRKYLLKLKEKNYIWIGGNYNWKANKWQWGYSGKDIGYQSFSQMIPGSSQDLRFHCAVLNPDLKYRWSAKLCTEKLNFICQHKMPLVSSLSRAKVYTRWNETFPNELANEVEVVVADQPRIGNLKDRDYYRTQDSPKLNLTRLNRNWKKINRTHRIKSFRNRNRAQARNEYISNDIIRRPVVEYASDNSYNSINGNGNGNGNGYRNGNGAFNRGFNVDIHRQKPHKDRMSNEVNGEFRHHRHRRPSTEATPTTSTTSTTTTTTTSAPETLPTEALQVVTENHRLPKADRKSRRDQIRERLSRLTPEEREQFYTKRASTTEKYLNKAQLLSHEEKKARRNNLRERLARLTPEEREMYFTERAKRKQSKKLRTTNETIP
ncbi:AAEL003119-PA [Aedes aegypti]|uniref:AAEL003119-PA n=1 Tax=Aedes aegypti TaxID=7159 RepID=Q17GC2_AEDAE|nr:AAEL003119-PA [Aedes aegypti]